MPTTIHNIIVGKLWLENAGKMTITDHGSGLTCELDFKAYSIFSSQEVGWSLACRPGGGGSPDAEVGCSPAMWMGL